MSRDPFQYAVLRVVPRVDRGESMNGGVLLYCPARRFVGARVHLDTDRLRALDPAADAGAVEQALHRAVEVCDGDPTADPENARLHDPRSDDPGRRFGWLTAPRSTVVQPGPVHTGLTTDPEADLDRLLRLLVLPPA